MIRALFVSAMLTVLCSCTPTFRLSLFNASGTDLVVNGHNGETVRWTNETYLSFHNTLSNMIGPDYPDIQFRISDPDGQSYLYEIDRADSDTFRFVSSGSLGQTQEPASVTAEPVRACIHIRIEADMHLYWSGNGCGRKNLKDSSISEQPAGFPVAPQRQ